MEGLYHSSSNYQVIKETDFKIIWSLIPRQGLKTSIKLVNPPHGFRVGKIWVRLLFHGSDLVFISLRMYMMSCRLKIYSLLYLLTIKILTMNSF